MEYRIQEAVSTEELEKQVNALIVKGWMPQGGVACLAEGPYGEPSYLQAMVKSG